MAIFQQPFMTGGFPSMNRVAPVNNPDIDIDFTEYASQAAADAVWVPTGDNNMRVDVTNDYLTCTNIRNNTDNHCYMDVNTVGSITLSDTGWRCRFKSSTISGSGGTSNSFFWGISDLADGADATTHEAIGGSDNMGGAGFFESAVPEDSSFSGGVEDQQTPITYTNGEDRWIENRRLTATTSRVEWFSDSTYSTSVEVSDGTPTATTNAQRYQIFSNRGTELSNNGETDVYRIDDYKLWNNLDDV